MNNKRKGFIAAVVALILVISPFGTLSSNAESNIISETSAKQTLTQGVTLENIVRFTTYGWYNINVLRVDLSNPYIKVDALTNQDSVSKLSTVKSMASQAGAIAAVNASFFTPDGGGKGHPVGTVIQNGNVVSASEDINMYGDAMASLSISKLNEILFDYWKTDISLVTANGTFLAVQQYNKISTSKYTDLSIYDRKWGATAIGATADMPDVVQMVVVGGIVTQMLYSQPAVQIPENGYVVVTRDAGGQQLAANFAVGDTVGLDISTNPDWKNLNASVSGASVLVRNGQIPASFSFNVSDVATSSPKTAIGSSKDGKQLILVTVDGRQNSSIGMSQANMAKFMLEAGAYNAINMDGGGSTTMVARPLGNTSLRVMNSPSDNGGSPRSVSTALGIFSIAPPSTLGGLIIDTEDTNIFVNTSRAFSVRGYDKYFNPLTVDPKSIKWSVSGVKGTFKDNVFHPTSYGEGKITAKVGSITASLPISVLSTPAELTLSSTVVKLPVGQTKTFTVDAVNKNGYTALLDAADVKWAVKGGVGTVSNGVFTAKAKGTGYIDAYIGSIHSYCAVSVATDNTTVRDKFETDNGSFTSYPDSVQGAYEISNDYYHSGKASGKLTYAFERSDNNRAAYMVLANGGLTLEAGASKIGVWVYNDHVNSNWVRAEVYDSNGEKQVLDLTKGMDWTGWKLLEASLDGVSLPAKLTRLYAVQTNPVEDSGSIYLDDLSVTNSGYPQINMDKLPKDTVLADDSNKAVSFTKATSTSFRFGVFGQSRAPKNPLEKLLMTKFAKKVDSYLDNAIIVGNGAHDSVSGLIKKKKVLATNTVDLSGTKDINDSKYSYTDIRNSRFFKLDMRQNGLRLSDPAQWQQFLADLNSFKGSNVFIMMEDSPETFTDKLELDFFKDTLSDYKQKTGKTVWVFFQGSKNESYMERGVKYISTAGYQLDGLTPDKANDASYVLVTVKGSAVTYTFKSING